MTNKMYMKENISLNVEFNNNKHTCTEVGGQLILNLV